jgi:hypothetical protein
MSHVTVTKEELMRAAEKVLERVADLVVEKNLQYGDAWQDLDIFTPLMRIREKLIRVETLNKEPAIVAVEGADKELPDIAGYCLLGILKFEANALEKESKIPLSPEQKIIMITNSILNENKD